MAKRLTAKQKKFVDEYLIDLNATQAAIRAGYSEKTARTQGNRMLTNVDIQNYLVKRQNKCQERTEITQDMIIDELAKIGLFDLTDEEMAGLIKASDKIKALELLGKHLGIFNKLDLDVKIQPVDKTIEELDEYLCKKKQKDT